MHNLKYILKIKHFGTPCYPYNLSPHWMLQHFIKLIFKYKYDSWPRLWFPCSLWFHPGFRWPAISLRRALLAIALGVQIAPSVMIQRNGQPWLMPPPNVCEEEAQRLSRRWPWDPVSHRAKATAGQKLSKPSTSGDKGAFPKAWVSHTLRV